MINRNKPVPLYWQIKEILEEEIKQGKYKIGEVFATEDYLIKRFNVSRVTAIKTLNELEKEGYVKRERKKGTILISSKKEKDKFVLSFVQPKTHIYQTLIGEIISRLSFNGNHVVISDWQILKEKELSKYFSFNYQFIIVKGISAFPFHILEDIAYQTHLIFILFYEREEKIPGSYVLFDYPYGAKLQVEHLLDCGYKNIVFLTHKILPYHLNQIKALDTVEKTLKDRNFKGNYVIFETPSGEGKLKELLKKLGKNTGFLCSQDDRTSVIYKVVRELNWNIPEDVGIVGYFNTPWTEIFYPSLTSVSIKEKEIAENVTEIIMKDEKREVIIKPELIIRESTRKDVI